MTSPDKKGKQLRPQAENWKLQREQEIYLRVTHSSNLLPKTDRIGPFQSDPSNHNSGLTQRLEWLLLRYAFIYICGCTQYWVTLLSHGVEK